MTRAEKAGNLAGCALRAMHRVCALYGVVPSGPSTRNPKRATLLLTLLTLLLFSGAAPAFAQQFTAKSLGDHGNVTVMEVTGRYDAENPDGSTNSIPRQEIAKEFFKTHQDEYDFLVIFSNFNLTAPQGEQAFYQAVRNDTLGIGQEVFDRAASYGSAGRLQGTIDMGNFTTLVADPKDPKFEDTLGLLSHALLHRWAANVKFRDADGNDSQALLDRSGKHWSFLLDTTGSLLRGNTWRDNGDGTFTSTTPLREMKSFSPLDLYLMGMIDKAQVPPMLLIDNPTVDPDRLPEMGVTISGTRRAVTIDTIIAATGERQPDAASSPKTFKTAFILVTAPQTFTGNELPALEAIRNGTLTRFSILTDGRSLLEVSSAQKQDIATNPGVQVITPVRNLPPSLNEGAAWLRSRQQADGSWRDQDKTAERDTAEAVLAMRYVSNGILNYRSGTRWLSRTTSNNTDFLSRKVEAISGSADVSLLVGEILARQNSDGGWGSGSSFRSAAGDTGRALQALSAAGYGADGVGDTAVVPRAIAYLKAAQKPDKGWGGDDTSMVQDTALVLSQLNKYRALAAVDDAITQGTAWLISHQNPEGGFGNSPSTVYDTAAALKTLRELNESPLVTNKAISYIMGRQSSDGSWNGSAYDTALALDVVLKATIGVDLSILAENISVTPATINSLSQNVVVDADIWNLGQNGTEATVALYINEVNELHLVDEQVLSFPGQAATRVSFMAAPLNRGDQRFIVVADPANRLREANRLNNSASKIVKFLSNLDLEVLPSDIAVSVNPAEMAQDVTITAGIRNKGSMDAYNVLVNFFVDAPGARYDIITKTLDVVPANRTVPTEAVWRTNRAGTNLPLTVVLDPYNEYAGVDLNGQNNKASVPITVNPNGRPNITVSYKDIIVTPTPSNERGKSQITAVVRNEGFSAARDIVVTFFCGVPGQIDSFPTGTVIIPLIGSGEQRSVSIDWPDIPVAGERIIYVQTISGGEEIRTDDNDAFIMLTILTLPDLMLSVNSITFDPAAPKDGDQVAIRAVVQNAGEQTAERVEVMAYDNGAEIASSTIASIKGNTQAAAVIPFNAAGKQGAHRITVTADPYNRILENNKSNNSAARPLAVQNRNLWLTEPIISPNGDGIKDSTQFFFRLEVAATVTVQIVSRLGNVVRIFSDPDFTNTTAGNITWDGLGSNGVLVNDGLYRIELRGTGNSLMGSLAVMVDTDRSPITDAVGTRYLLNNNLTCNLPDIVGWDWKWFPDESGIAAVVPDDPNTPDYQAGLYTVSADGVDVLRITPASWKNVNAGCEDASKLPCERYTYPDFAVSPDSAYVAAIVVKERAETFSIPSYNRPAVPNWKGSSVQLVTIDRDGRNIVPVEYDDANPPALSLLGLHWAADGHRLVYRAGKGGIEELWSVKPDGTEKTKIDAGALYDATNLYWSPDNDHIAYRVHTVDNTEELWSVRPDGSEKVRLAVETNGVFSGFTWSPDSSRMAYVYADQTLRVTDLSGTTRDVLAFSDWWFYLEWLGTRKLLLETYGSNTDETWIVDAAGSGSPAKFAFPSGYALLPSPKGDAVAFMGYLWRSWKDPAPFLKVVDADGKALYDWQDRIARGNCFANIEEGVWSPDGVKIAFYEELVVPGDGWGICTDDPYGPRIVSADVKTGKEWVASTAMISTGYLDDGYHYKVYPYGWLSGGAYGLSRQRVSGLPDLFYVMDFESGETRQLAPAPGVAVEWTSNFISPLERYFTYYREVDPTSVCAGKGSKDLWSMRSLLNLTVDLRIARKKTVLVLKGTASDLNFEGYKLEYADVKSPTVWTAVQPASDAPALNEILTNWVPPYEGIFMVRLTVWDRAGNVATDNKRITWGRGSILTSIYKTRNIISPKINDGVQDTVQVHYRVMEPANLEFVVLDQNRTVVWTHTESYATVPQKEEYIEWNGRDNNEKPVPDGLYIITILDYELAVEVDNTPPDIGMNISDVSNVKFVMDQSYFSEPYSDFFAHATDKNLKEWVIEYGEGENPQEWQEYMRGGVDLPQQFDEDNREVPLREYTREDLGWLSGKKFRITAVDTAGNVSTTIRSLNEELFVHMYGVKTPGVFLKKQPSKDLLDCLQHAQLGTPGSYVLAAVETFGPALITMNVQYKVNGRWMDAPAAAVPQSALFTLDWINRYTGQTITAIRIKAVDDIGRELFSNEICIEQPIEVGEGGGGGGGGGGGNGGGGGDPAGISLTLDYPGQICGQQSKPVGIVSPFGLMSSSAVDMHSGLLYITGPGGTRLLQQPLEIVDNGTGLQKWSMKPAVLDVSGLSEGAYSLNAAISYSDVASGHTGTASASAKLVVDRTFPTAQLYVSPCIERRSDVGGTWKGLLIQGVADDAVGVRQYDLVYSVSDKPDTWMPVMKRWYDPVAKRLNIDPISEKRANKAFSGNWDVSSLIGKTITMKLQVIDAGGNVSCTTKTFTVREPITLSGVLTAPKLFSPNGDGIIDTTEIQYQVNQDALIDVTAHRLLQKKDILELDSTAVKQVMSGHTYIRSAMGTDHILWDGTNDGFTPVGDGWYGLHIVATDECGYQTSGWDKVEVDDTRPDTTG